jgi:AhpC/TSA antioxidant enzyme
VAQRFAEFREVGFDAVAVAMSRPEGIARYLAERPLPLPVLADPDKTAYAAFSLKRTTWLRMFRPGIGWRFLMSVLRGGKIRRIPEGEDPLQTGGDFLFDDGKLVWAYTSPDPTDRPTVDQLLKTIRDYVHDRTASRS